MLPITFYNGASIMYQEVTEYFGDETTNIGKNVYDYDCTKWEENVFNCNEETYPMYFKQFQNDYGNYQPLLTSTTTYKNNNGQYETAKSVSNNYSEFKIDEFNTGLTFGSNIIIEGWGSMLGEVAFNYYDGNSGAYFSSLNYCDTKGHQDASLLTSSIETEYTNGQPVFTKNTEYAYDNYTQVATRTTSTSKNVDLTTNYNYPYDFKSEASPNIYNTMVDRNMLSFVVKQSDLAGTQPIQTVQTNYYNPNSNIIAPSTVNLGVGSNTPETRLRYYDYDNKGNVLCVSKENDVKNSYIWGYNQTYPIVKAENTTNVALASALTAATSDLETLLKNVGDMTSTTQRNTWKTFSSSLRSSLPGALVTMYTYKPLVGMTSSTDPNGVTSYYEYDTFGRLQYIKDDDGHILKTYEYHCQQ
jgi:YD repeat-containing protein